MAASDMIMQNFLLVRVDLISQTIFYDTTGKKVQRILPTWTKWLVKAENKHM